MFEVKGMVEGQGQGGRKGQGAAAFPRLDIRAAEIPNKLERARGRLDRVERTGRTHKEIHPLKR